jgi:O-antigen/teichoic acid export membrane protein
LSNPDDASGIASEFVRLPPTDGVVTPVSNPASAGAQANSETDRVLMHGIAWSAASKWLTQIVSWASTIVVARLLSPNDYGLVGMAALYLGLVALVSEFGIGSAIVTLRDLTDDAIAQLNSVSLIVGTTIFAISIVAAQPLALFFRTPALVPVVLTLSISFIVGAFKSVPNAILQRDFKFRTLAAIDATKALVGALLAVILALLGFHYWALVLSEVIGVALATIVTIVKSPRRFAVPRAATIARAITYSRQVLVGRISWFVYSNSDFLVAGRMLGQAALGAYDFAWTLTNIPVEKLTSLVSNVTPTVFASVQHDRPALERAVLSLTEGIATIAFPVSIGLALVSADLVLGVFGEKWAHAVVPLELLGIYTAMRSVMPIVPSALNVRGKTRFLMYHGVISAIAFPLTFFLASRYGTTGIAGAWVVLYPISCAPLLYMLFREVTSLRAYWGALRGPTIATAAMAALVFIAGRMVAPLESALIRLLVEVAVGAAVYSGAALVLFPARILAFRQILRTAF